MGKLKMMSPDLTAQNIEKIGELFPNVITEVRAEDGSITRVIDFDLLKQELSSTVVEGPVERYQLDWPGKRESLLAANAPIAKTLRPAPKESVNFDETENLFIEGDNLEALKLLQESYLGKVKMIYIDPPYNTGNDFVYKDNFPIQQSEYDEISSQKDEEGNRLVSNTESNGRFHSDWLSMMHSRLRLSRNLLTDDGVIFISIDDNEQANLKRLCDEILGEQNFLAVLPTVMNLKGNNDQFGFSGTHEYTLVYAKNIELLTINEFIVEEKISEWEIDELGYFKEGANLKSTGTNAPREKRPNLFFPILLKNDEISFPKDEEVRDLYDTDSKTFDDNYLEILKKKYVDMGFIVIFPETNGVYMSWRWQLSTMRSKCSDIIIKGNALYKKQRPELGGVPTTKPKSIFYKPEYSSGNGTAQLVNLFGSRLFDNPKPINLIKDFILLSTDINSTDIILDFFAGSSTTAHAVMQLNAEDGGNRKFIMVQLPEVTDEKSEAYKAGYQTIAEISKERIRRAGKQILESDEIHEDWNRDIGFRVFKVDSSNMKEVYYQPQELTQADLLDQVDNVKEDRTPEDLLFQVMLDWGLELSLPITTEEIEGKKVFFVAGDALIACFDAGITESLVQTLAAKEPLRLLFRDNHYLDNDTKINAEQLVKQIAPNTELKSI